jgi:hypothetical protein
MAAQEIQQTTRENRLLLWLIAFGSIVIWFSHFAFVYNVVDFGCATSLPDYRIADTATISTLVIIATIIASVLLLLIAFSGLTLWRRARNSEGDAEHVPAFMGLVGIALSIISLGVVILSTIPLFVLRTCGGLAGG